MPPIRFFRLPDDACSPYPVGPILRLQKTMLENKLAGVTRDNYVLFAQHENVSAHPNRKEYSRPIVTTEKERIGAPLVAFDECACGGSVTCHTTGQIVCYFIFDLSQFTGEDGFLPVGEFAEQLLRAVCDSLASYGIWCLYDTPGITREARGVWVDHRGVMKKVAAYGMRIYGSGKQSVSTFGFALNVSPDLSYFDRTYPCGCGAKMTSLEKILKRPVAITEICDKLQTALSASLGAETA